MKKYCRKVQPLSRVRHNVTDREIDDRRICDSKDPKVTYHIRVKIDTELVTQFYALLPAVTGTFIALGKVTTVYR